MSLPPRPWHAKNRTRKRGSKKQEQQIKQCVPPMQRDRTKETKKPENVIPLYWHRAFAPSPIWPVVVSFAIFFRFCFCVEASTWARVFFVRVHFFGPSFLSTFLAAPHSLLRDQGLRGFIGERQDSAGPSPESPTAGQSSSPSLFFP